MRCNPSYWLLGLVPIAMLSWVAVQFERDGIEADLGRRTQEALARQGLDWAVPIYSGRDGILTGKAPDENDPARGLSSMRDIWGVRIAQGRTELLDVVDKFSWLATRRTDGRVLLTGFVPNEDARKALLSVARNDFPNADLTDEMKLARGAPDRDAWLSGATFGLKQLAQLKKGSAGLDGLGLTVIGEAATPPAYRSVKTALAGGLPNGVALALEKITPPVINPFTWSAKSAGNQLTVTGHVPSEPVREALAKHAKKAFPAAAVSDKSDIADGAPEAFVTAVTASLSQLAALKSGSADIKGKEVIFIGEAADEAAAQTIRKALKTDVPQNYKISEQIKYPKPAAPAAPTGYVMSIAHDASLLEVAGFVPSEAARSALIDAVKARFPGLTVTDKLQILANAPDGWQQCIVAGLAALPRLKTGKSVLADRRLIVTGTTDDYGVAQSVPGDVKAAAGQTCETETDIAFSGEVRTNLVWRAAQETSNTLLLEGEVPDDASRSRLLESAQRLFPNARLVDQMKIAASPPEPWLSVALRGLQGLAKLRRGEAALNGRDLTVRGQAESEPVATDVRTALARDVPQGFSAKDVIEVMAPEQREAGRCEDMMRETTEKGILQFDRAKADLTADSTQTLRDLAEIANACPAFNIEIEGHTDAEGTDERNQRLSDRRARAVAEFLSRSGVDARRLTTVGYGASRPVADNATDDGRAKNRRIEFTVKVN